MGTAQTHRRTDATPPGTTRQRRGNLLGKDLGRAEAKPRALDGLRQERLEAIDSVQGLTRKRTQG